MDVLVAGLGMSPGAPFTAIMKTRPNKVFLFTSLTARAKGGKALTRALIEHDFEPDIEIEFIELDDPISGFREAYEKAAELASRLRAVSLVVNVAGGSSAIQYAVGEVVALKGGRVYASFDERPPNEIERNPFVIGGWTFLKAIPGLCM